MLSTENTIIEAATVRACGEDRKYVCECNSTSERAQGAKKREKTKISRPVRYNYYCDVVFDKQN